MLDKYKYSLPSGLCQLGGLCIMYHTSKVDTIQHVMSQSSFWNSFTRNHAYTRLLNRGPLITFFVIKKKWNGNIHILFYGDNQPLSPLIQTRYFFLPYITRRESHFHHWIHYVYMFGILLSQSLQEKNPVLHLLVLCVVLLLVMFFIIWPGN